jgi:hypothetical protein
VLPDILSKSSITQDQAEKNSVPFSMFLSGIDVGWQSTPDLVNLHGDGDLDAILGESEGRLVFFRSSAMVFANGFEDGTTSAWSVTVPVP